MSSLYDLYDLTECQKKMLQDNDKLPPMPSDVSNMRQCMENKMEVMVCGCVHYEGYRIPFDTDLEYHWCDWCMGELKRKIVKKKRECVFCYIFFNTKYQGRYPLCWKCLKLRKKLMGKTLFTCQYFFE